MMRVRAVLAATLCGLWLMVTADADAGAGGPKVAAQRGPNKQVLVQAATAPTHVQHGNAIVAAGSGVAATFANPTTAGHLIVAYVVWDNAGTASVSDDAGNVYVPAGVERTAWANSAYSAQVFYAKNITGGATTVSATLGTPASSFAILYIHEYAGLDRTNPLDVSAATRGTSKAMGSPVVTTTNANDLLFGAGASIGAVTKGDTAFTVRSFAHGNVTEDRVVTATGPYKATATHTGGSWVMQIAAFKAEESIQDTTPPSTPSGVTATAISASQINLSWTAATDNVGVIGYTIYRDGQTITTVNGTSFQDTGLTSATTYTYAVSAIDGAANASAPSTPASATTHAAPDPTSCALPNYPTPDCTGVPAGTTFVRTIEGTYTANTPGEVIDRWHIKGSLIVNADDVVITHSQIDDTVSNDPNGTQRHPFTISDSTVGPDVCGTPTWMPNGIGFERYTAIRVKVRGHEDGFRAAGPDVTIRDSYYRACVTGESHADGVQDYPSAQRLVVEHSTFDMANLPGGYTAPLYVNSTETSDVHLTDNLVLGGVYGLFLQPTHGTWVVTGNRVVDNTWAYAPYETTGLCGNISTWSDNTVVTIDATYRITSTIRTEPCPQ